MSKHHKELLQLLRGNPRGWTALDLAKSIHLSRWRTLELLRELRKAGSADVTCHGGGALWSTPERCVVLRKLAAERRRKRERTRLRAQQKSRQEAAAAAAWLQPSQRVLPALDAPSIRPVAPASVFCLATA